MASREFLSNSFLLSGRQIEIETQGGEIQGEDQTLTSMIGCNILIQNARHLNMKAHLFPVLHDSDKAGAHRDNSFIPSVSDKRKIFS